MNKEKRKWVIFQNYTFREKLVLNLLIIALIIVIPFNIFSLVLIFSEFSLIFRYLFFISLLFIIIDLIILILKLRTDKKRD